MRSPNYSVPNVTMEFNGSNAFFDFNKIKMICRLIDERYPDYENVIPADNENNITIGNLVVIFCFLSNL